MGNFYDGTKLLSLMDIEGNKPEIYICTTNRSGGKTTYFGRLLVSKYLEKGEKFALLYRYNYELDNIADKFFKEIGNLFFPEYTMISERRASGIYHELFLVKNGTDEFYNCGYGLTLNNADQIKKNSHFFSDVSRIMFDEFQSETNHYCPDEITKFISIHKSVARGGGKQSRYVPVYMLSNPVSIINPYYTELGISERLREDTKYLRGVGYVLEQGYVESAARASEESAFDRAFQSNAYIAYSSQAVYLNDSQAFIEKPNGKMKYICTIKYKNREYAIKEFPELGVVYCDDKPDKSFKLKITVTTDDHNINYVMLKRGEFFLNTLRYYFERGCFRFKDLRCKEAVLKLLSY